jgi:hypothetical protein
VPPTHLRLGVQPVSWKSFLEGLAALNSDLNLRLDSLSLSLHSDIHLGECLSTLETHSVPGGGRLSSLPSNLQFYPETHFVAKVRLEVMAVAVEERLALLRKNGICVTMHSYYYI